jgi:hypothetical protein
MVENRLYFASMVRIRTLIFRARRVKTPAPASTYSASISPSGFRHLHSDPFPRRNTANPINTMGAFWGKIRSGYSLIFDAKSTRWPHNTRSVARNILIASIVAAIGELSMCAVLSHQLLPMKNTVSCWENANMGMSNHDLGAVRSDLVLREEVELPVTFANANMLMSGENAFEDYHLVFGPKYLSVRKRADTL